MWFHIFSSSSETSAVCSPDRLEVSTEPVPLLSKRVQNTNEMREVVGNRGKVVCVNEEILIGRLGRPPCGS